MIGRNTRTNNYVIWVLVGALCGLWHGTYDVVLQGTLLPPHLIEAQYRGSFRTVFRTFPFEHSQTSIFIPAAMMAKRALINAARRAHHCPNPAT